MKDASISSDADGDAQTEWIKDVVAVVVDTLHEGIHPWQAGAPAFVFTTDDAR